MGSYLQFMDDDINLLLLCYLLFKKERNTQKYVIFFINNENLKKRA